MDRTKWIACSLLTCLPAIPVASSAATVMELESTVNEQQKALEKYQKDLEKYDKEIKKLNKKVKIVRRNQKKGNTKFNNFTDRLKINGFVTAGIATTDGAGEYKGITNTVSTQPDSIMGLQFKFKINDKVDFTSQIVSRGTEFHDVKADWAFLSYAPNSNHMFRAGRLRNALYTYSDFLGVGYGYPWVRPPLEVYFIPTDSVEGFDYIYSFELGNWYGYAQAAVGRSVSKEEQLLHSDFSTDEYKTLSVRIENDAWMFRIGFAHNHPKITPQPGGNLDQLWGAINQAKTVATNINSYGVPGLLQLFDPSVPDSLPEDFKMTNEPTAKFVNAGFSYDNGKFFVTGEATYWELKDMVFPAGEGGYLTAGYRFGRFTPHITYGAYYTNSKDDKLRKKLSGNVDALSEFIGELTDTASANPAILAFAPFSISDLDPECGGLLDINGNADTDARLSCVADKGAALGGLSSAINQLTVDQKSVTIGLNYDFMPGIRFKVEASKYFDFGGTFGRFETDPGDDTYVYSAAVTAVF